ncbi:MAG: Gfo/Idh/MocA family protein [Acidimicrobiales bacterium]
MTNVVVVGAGRWAHDAWGPLLLEHAARFTVAAVVDPDLDGARSLARSLGLEAGACHETVDEALDQAAVVEAGVVLNPPDQHARTIVHLAERGLHVLTEKPLATDPDDLDLILRAVRHAGVKAAVIQNYRYQNRIRVARRILAAGELGRLRYLVARFAADYRAPGAWHGDRSNVLVDTAIHHVDVLRYLAGAEITHVTAVTANPDPSLFASDCLGGLLIRFDDGSFALYEATLLAAGSENRWRTVSYRAECSDGALVCDGPEVRLLGGRHIQSIPAPDTDRLDGHRHQLRAFADWLDGGPAVETTIEDNSRSMAAVFAALTSDRARSTVPVAAASSPAQRRG